MTEKIRYLNRESTTDNTARIDNTALGGPCADDTCVFVGPTDDSTFVFPA